ncbi:hypothetical protein ABW20_dc0110356 [Dactylellina cionopaga]|nr:hypothetical protein ABW20_dc0110356 [Dactylellina cionopaga]
MERLESAFQNLPNLKTLEFSRMYETVQDFEELDLDNQQKLFKTWEKHDPALHDIPDWKRKFETLLNFSLIEPLYTECFPDTIYADTLFCAVKAQEYRDVFKELRTMYLHVDWGFQRYDPGRQSGGPLPIRPQVLSPLFAPAVENFEELYLSQHGIHHVGTHGQMLLPIDTYLPKLCRLKMGMGRATFQEFSTFLSKHRDTLREFIASEDHRYIYRLKEELVTFLKEIHTNLSLTEFDLEVTVFERKTAGVSQFGAFVLPPGKDLRLGAVGSWKAGKLIKPLLS